MHNFRKLTVWKLSRELGSEIYATSVLIKKPEARVITTQLRRAALSISANIAEGCGKTSRAETIRYLDIAGAPAAETEHHLIVASETGGARCPDGGIVPGSDDIRETNAERFDQAAAE